MWNLKQFSVLPSCPCFMRMHRYWRVANIIHCKAWTVCFGLVIFVLVNLHTVICRKLLHNLKDIQVRRYSWSSTKFPDVVFSSLKSGRVRVRCLWNISHIDSLEFPMHGRCFIYISESYMHQHALIEWRVHEHNSNVLAKKTEVSEFEEENTDWYKNCMVGANKYGLSGKRKQRTFCSFLNTTMLHITLTKH